MICDVFPSNRVVAREFLWKCKVVAFDLLSSVNRKTERNFGTHFPQVPQFKTSLPKDLQKFLQATDTLLPLWDSYQMQCLECTLFTLHVATSWRMVLKIVLSYSTGDALNNKTRLHVVFCLLVWTWQVRLLAYSKMQDHFPTNPVIHFCTRLHITQRQTCVAIYASWICTMQESNLDRQIL